MEYILFIVIVVVFIAIGAALYGNFYVKNEAREKYLERKKEKSRDVVYDYDSKSQSEEIEKTKKEDKKDGVYESYYENGALKTETNWKDGECISGDC